MNPITSDIEVRMLAVARDNSTSSMMDLELGMQIIDEAVELACFGARSKNPAKARFHEVFTDKAGVAFLGRPKYNKKAKR